MAENEIKGLIATSRLKEALGQSEYEIADFTLFSMNRLSRDSFKGLPFSEIVFSHAVVADCKPVHYLKVHGSFNWWTNLGDTSKVYYCLVSKASAAGKSPRGNTFFPIILPTLTKDVIYNEYPIFKAHIDGFLSHLAETARLILVGKSFRNSDRELNKLMADKCRSSTRKLIIIDPQRDDPSFVTDHEVLFNAVCSEAFASLAAFAQASAL